ncbi:uncharacterized protein BXZ73DRAFT_106343 [Epithele typhae]|uniref:uncharacterized protein n=1 Tax=Epithele typhae TaxID=378194 RepID=UPI0020081D22|nr:uncharacterized protein BXZ73DRAFT_106343 [Epithele typhae]KAH9915033.1 hypothetical protein BXZ73DRAFT_106343 [Epithele typhae]
MTTTALFWVGLALIQRVSSTAVTCFDGYYITGRGGCSACPAGTYSGANAASCSSCPANTFSAGTAPRCTACPSGTVSNPGSASCTLQNTCSPGAYFDGRGCSACPVNTYSGPVATLCVACPDEQVSGVGSSSCHACASGTHYDSGACVIDAVTCSPGQFVNNNACYDCAANTHSMDGFSCVACPDAQVSDAGSSSCHACDSGTHYDSGSCVVDTPTCTPGQYPLNGECSSCAANTYSTDGTECIPCPSSEVSDPASSECHACADGTHYDADSATCIVDPPICPAGTYLNGDTCTLCAAGSYSGDGATQCEECPAGQFSWEGASACCSCCSGFYSDHPGASTCAHSGPTCPDVGGANPSSLNSQSTPRRRAVQCRFGQRSCPVYGISADGRGYIRGSECVDVRTDLESCGGCVADDPPLGARNADGGRDCSAIPHTGRVACRGGACVIESCASGFTPSEDGEACIASSASDALHRLLNFRSVMKFYIVVALALINAATASVVPVVRAGTDGMTAGVEELRREPGTGPDWRREPGTGPDWRREPGTGPDWRREPGTSPDWRREPGTSPDWRREPGTSPDWRREPGTGPDWRREAADV